MRFFILFLILLAVPLFQACDQASDAETPTDEIIALEVKDEANLKLKADGRSTVTLIARIPSRAKDQLIKFHTSSGTFKETDQKTDLELPAINGQATAILIVGSTPGPFFVKASVDKFVTEPKQLELQPVGINEIIKLAIVDNVSALKANGTSQIKLRATIPPGSAEKNVVFEATDGFFVGATGNVKAIQETVRENDGVAEAILTVSTTPGPLYVTAAVGKYKTDPQKIDLQPLAAEDILDLAITPADVKADNVSTIQLTAHVKNSPVTQVQITASSGAGTILGAADATAGRQLDVDQTGKAQVFLKVGTEPGPHLITVSINEGKTSLTKNVSFAPAFPTKMLLELSASRADTVPGKYVDLDAFLLRETGLVSAGRQVQFEAVQTINQKPVSVGRFSSGGTVFSDATGKASIRFYTDTNDIQRKKNVSLKATTTREDGSVLEQTTELYIE